MVPDTVHFIFGLREDFGGKPFSFLHYLAVRSAAEVHRPSRILFHHRYRPSGEWWDKSLPYLTPVAVEPPSEVFGRKLRHYAHQADVLRLEILLREGGVYLDMDVLSLRSFRPLYPRGFVMGRQYDGRWGKGRPGLCNAVMLAEPEHPFVRKWHESYRSFRSWGKDYFWDEHSVKLPLRMARENPSLIHVEEEGTFFYPGVKEPEVLWSDRPADFGRAWCVHLWESTFWWDRYLKKLDPAFLRESPVNFARLFRRYAG
jgi:hypothetical protein